MKHLTALALLSTLVLMPVSVAAKPAASFLTPGEESEVDQALALLGMDRRDLSFNKDYVNAGGKVVDRWRVPMVNTILKTPLEGPRLVRALVEPMTAGHMDPANVLVSLAHAKLMRYGADQDLGWKSLAAVLQDLGVDAQGRAELAKLPAAVQDRLARLIRDQGQAREVLAQTVADLDEDLPALLERHFDLGAEATSGEDLVEHDARKLLRNWDAYSRRDVADAAATLAADMAALRETVSDLGGVTWNGKVDIHARSRRVIIAGSGVDGNDLAADLIVDFGGDDTYVLGQAPSPVGRVQVILDLAGNDRYDAGGASAQLGAGLLGIGLLEDGGGDDIYRAGRFSLGAGVYGIGMLHDLGGNDIYAGDTVCEGAGAFGVGYLRDGVGNDTYRAAGYAQGFAYTGGSGLLEDVSGADSYYAGGKYMDNPSRFASNSLSLSQGFAIGIRPYVGGGLGVLVDGGGNDAYWTEVYGQGTSYWFSLGLLWDKGGDDTYHSLQYAQGSGIHLSVGMLVDDAGHDNYTCDHLGQGSSHDLSVGFLIDHAGNDVYAGISTLQGGALTNSATFFIDDAGDDTYAAHELATSRGTANVARGWGGVGVFLDLGGKDAYTAAPDGDPAHAVLHDNTVVRSGSSGIAVDKEGTPAIAAAPAAAGPAKKAGAKPLPRDPVARLRMAAIWENDQATQEAARASLIADGPKVLPRLLETLKDEKLMMQYGLENVVNGMTRAPKDADDAVKARYAATGEAASSVLLDHLARHTGALSYEGLRWPVRWVGELGKNKERAVAALKEHAFDREFRVRHAVADALGTLGDAAASETLAAMTRDPEDSVRAVAAGSLGKVGGAGAVAALARTLEDAMFGPRDNARHALVDLAGRDQREAVLEAVRPLLKSAQAKVAWAAADILGALKDEASRSNLEAMAALADAALSDAGKRALEALGK